MRKMLLVCAIFALSACSKTGEVEVEKPVVGAVIDTVAVPTLDVTTQEQQVTMPGIDINKDTASIMVPKIEIKTP